MRHAHHLENRTHFHRWLRWLGPVGASGALLVLAVGFVVGSGCTGGGDVSALPQTGAFSILSYNVAGLPSGLSSGDPVINIPKISPLLNAYDVVLVQEDFSFQRELREDVDHAYQSLPLEPTLPIGDGLNRFSRYFFDDDPVRQRWSECSGVIDGSNDCLAEKGFSLASHEVAPGIEIDIVNLHMDAGGGEEDRDARATQVEQLLDFLADNETGRPLIVAGDTNIRPSRGDDDDTALRRLIDGASLRDSCAELGCGEEDRIDRILVRDGDSISIFPRQWRVADEFVDDDGVELSDHEAIALRVVFSGEEQ